MTAVLLLAQDTVLASGGAPALPLGALSRGQCGWGGGSGGEGKERRSTIWQDVPLQGLDVEAAVQQSHT